MDPERALMWRVLFWVLLAGGTIGAIASVFVPTSRTESIGTLVLSGVIFAVVAFIGARPDRLPDRFAHVVVAYGTVSVTLGLYVNGETVTDDEMYYLWVSLFAFYFFTRREALVHVALVAAAYAVVLVAVPVEHGQSAARWLVTVSTLLVAGLLVGFLKERARKLIDRLSEAARTDPLTGLLNRSGFNDAFAVELARARRTGERFALIVGDLDRFKEVNDRLGHQRGDRALERVSAILHEWTRSGDRAARLGGEEFALIVHNVDDEALDLAERVRAHVRDAFADDPVPLTISFGVALHPGDGDDEDELLAAADRALYAAKAAGRDRALRANASPA